MDLAVVISLILVVVYIGIAIIGYWRKYLFSLPIEYKNDLKAGIISDSIKRAFRENNFPLSITARIVTEDESANPEKKEPNTDTKEVNNDKKDEKEEQKSWFIEDNEKLYLINESKDKINVYQRLGILEKYDFQMMGPFLMWRTEKGKKLIDKIAKKRTFWKTYGTIAIVIAIISMIFNMALLIIEDIMATEIPESAAPTPQMIIGLPGINPYIPIWYGILGLAVAIIIHEFAHGILSRVGKITIKSLGILFCVVPVGAFVEPDETEIMSVDKRTRARMFAAGPSTNVIFSLICAMLFSWVFMGSIAPVHDGIIVTQIVKDSPAMQKELLPGMGIIGAYVIENNEITPQWYDVSDLYEYGKMLNETSGKRLALQVDDSYTIADNTTLVHRIYILDSDPILPSRLGIVLSPEVTYVQPNSNAELVGINTKMTFVSITDGTKTVSPNSPLDYYKFLTDHKPGDNVSVLMDINGSIQAYTITLEDLSNFTKDSNDIGIATPGFGTSVIINKIEKWSPAWGVKSAGISPGMLIYRIAKISNGTIDQNSITYLKGPTDFTNFMDKTNAYDLLRVNAVKDGKEEYIAYVILVDKSFVTGDLEFKGKGYLGVASINANAFKESLAHPFQASEGNPFLFFYYSINYILLPLQRLSPFPTSITMNFVITGPLSFLPSEIFWIAANAFYWLFWLNLMVGITNTLPATPLDGGLIFRDWLDTLFSKFKLSKEKRENYVKLTSRAMSVTILFMILWLIIAPRLMAILF